VWNGTNWTALGSGMNATVDALAVSGSNVYAGGYFTRAGGNFATNIAKWSGSSWSALGTGMNNYVRTLGLSGSQLYAGGAFTRPVVARPRALPNGTEVVGRLWVRDGWRQ